MNATMQVSAMIEGGVLQMNASFSMPGRLAAMASSAVIWIALVLLSYLFKAKFSAFVQN